MDDRNNRPSKRRKRGPGKRASGNDDFGKKASVGTGTAATPGSAGRREKWLRIRVYVCAVIFACLGGLVIRRAFELQVQKSAYFEQQVQKHSNREIELPAWRGRILDRNRKDLAATVEVDSVVCNPRQLSHAPEAVDEIAEALNMDRAKVAKVLAKDKYFAWLKREVTPAQADAVKALHLRGCM